jgi:hypothetical protein
MQTDVSAEQAKNAESPITESLESVSKATAESDRHWQKHAWPNVPTDEGIQIDESDGHSRNAHLSITESLESGPKVTVERDSQAEKQCSASVSTDGGMHIDESNEQLQNAESPMRESAEPDSKTTLEIVRLLAKHQSPIVSMSFAIINAAPVPKYFRSDAHAKSTRQSSRIPKFGFPSAIEMLVKLVFISAHESNCWNPDGSQIDESNEQVSNTPSSIRRSLESDSSLNVKSERHVQKQLQPSCSTEEGIEIDKSEKQEENAEAPRAEILEPGWTPAIARDVQP